MHFKMKHECLSNISSLIVYNYNVFSLPRQIEIDFQDNLSMNHIKKYKYKKEKIKIGFRLDSLLA